MANRKPLEGIEALMFVIGAGTGILLAKQGYSWWLVLIIIIILGLGLGKLVQFLKNKNRK